jgi:hypothetical protein
MRPIGYYHIKIQQWKDRDTRIDDKWSIGYWDGKCFEEFNEMYYENELVEIDERRIVREETITIYTKLL